MSEETDQARIAFDYYVRGKRTHLWDPATRKWVPVSQAPPQAQASQPPGLSQRALNRIAAIDDAERRGVINHDAADRERLQIVREES